MSKYNYVVYFIIKGRIEQAEAEKIFEEITREYSKTVEILKTDFVGKRKLAYSVEHNTEGYFGIIDFEVNDKPIAYDTEEILKANDNVLKFMTIRKED